MSTWIGAIGRNGRKMLAPITLNMFPKFELAPILMYFVMLPNTLRPSSTPSSEHRQALLEQDDVGGFLGDVDGAVDGNADIRRLERRAIIDAVTQEADDVPFAMQGIDDRGFLRRRDLGEDGSGLGQVRHLRRRDSVSSSLAEHDAVHRQSDFMADLAGDDVVVTGENLHLHAAGLQSRDGLPRPSPWAGRGMRYSRAA